MAEEVACTGTPGVNDSRRCDKLGIFRLHVTDRMRYCGRHKAVIEIEKETPIPAALEGA